MAAFDTATGALSTAFNPTGVNSQARAVVATGDTVYVGGGFAGLGNGQLRNNLVAFRASDGAVLPWNPNADYAVWAVAVSGDGQSVFAGGSFTHVNGLDAYGLAKIAGHQRRPRHHVEAGRPQRRTRHRHQQPQVQGSFLYGTSWSFGSGGNLEGAFKIPVDQLHRSTGSRRATATSTRLHDRRRGLHRRASALLRSHGWRLPPVPAVEVPALAWPGPTRSAARS